MGNTVVDDVRSVEFDNDATRLCYMHLGHPSECGMMELHKRNLLRVFVVASWNCVSIVYLGNCVMFGLRSGNTKQRDF